MTMAAKGPTATEKDLIGRAITIRTEQGDRPGQVFGIVRVGPNPMVWAVVEDASGLTTFQGCVAASGHFQSDDTGSMELAWTSSRQMTETQGKAGILKIRAVFSLLQRPTPLPFLGDLLTEHPAAAPEPEMEPEPEVGPSMTVEELLADIMSRSCV